jgi:hypothetical protein
MSNNPILDLDLIHSSALTPEQRDIVKTGIEEAIQKAMNFRGVRDHEGRPVVKFAFLKKKHIKRIKYMKVVKMSDGRNMYVRVF